MKMKNRTKLLIIHPTIAPYRIDFFNALYDAFDAQICLQYQNLKSQKFDYKKISDQFHFKPVYLPEGSALFLCKAVWAQIKEFMPDIVLTCEFGPVTLTSLLFKICNRRKIRLVVMTDDSYDMVVDGNDFTIRHRLARQIISTMVDEFIVVSPQVEKWYQEKYNKGVWMPIIVNDDRATANYQRLLSMSRELAERYNLAGKKVLLSVSRLVDLKNLHRVIEAFAKCKNDAALVIVGDGPERDALLEHAGRVNREIIIPGRFEGDELYAWYNLASVFILASYKEPFGAVTNEALLAGCRVVISEKAGSSCLVDGNNGEMVNPMNVTEITKAIDNQMELSVDLDMQLGRNSLMTIKFEERINNVIVKI